MPRAGDDIGIVRTHDAAHRLTGKHLRRHDNGIRRLISDGTPPPPLVVVVVVVILVVSVLIIR